MKQVLLLALLLSNALAACRERCVYTPEELAEELEKDWARLTGSREQRRGLIKEMTRWSFTDYDRTLVVTGFLAEHFDWTATDYQQRTVEEILQRRGGNCAELARVTVALLEDLDLRMRKVREINIHVESPSRQLTAEEKVREKGNKMSVFGRRHNDHVWVEVYDRVRWRWFPADPSLGVVGEEAWLRARLGFGERFTMDPSSEDMIAPFAVFAYGDDGKLAEDRTRRYLIEGFNSLYDGRLEKLEPWPEWVRLVESLKPRALGAFEGSVNLHDYSDEIDELAQVYERLKTAFLASER